MKVLQDSYFYVRILFLIQSFILNFYLFVLQMSEFWHL